MFLPFKAEELFSADLDFFHTNSLLHVSDNSMSAVQQLIIGLRGLEMRQNGQFMQPLLL